MSEKPLDPERQHQAKIYARLRRRLMLVELVIGGLYMLAWLVFGWSSALEAWLSNYTSNPWLLVAGYALVFGGLYYLISLPLSYYEGFILPHRFKLSTQTLGGWVLDQLKGLLVGGVLGLLLLELIYALLRAAPDTWWFWAAILLLFFNVILANLAPVVLFPIFNKFSPLAEEYSELAERLVRLSERARTHIKGVYQFDLSRRTTAANAALTGLGSTRRIILGDTLLQNFSSDEIETVLAHELGHHVHRDIPLGVLVGSLLTLVGFYLAGLVMAWGVAALGFDSPGDIAALPLLAIVISLYGLVTMPLENAFSRWRERGADQYALQATGNGQAYASALRRLADQNLAEADPEAWVEILLYSHPALSKRIAMAEAYAVQSMDSRT
jgi:STE24 endopeptidase